MHEHYQAGFNREQKYIGQKYHKYIWLARVHGPMWIV